MIDPIKANFSTLQPSLIHSLIQTFTNRFPNNATIPALPEFGHRKNRMKAILFHLSSYPPYHLISPPSSPTN